MKHEVSREEFDKTLLVFSGWMTVLSCYKSTKINKRLERMTESGKNTQYRVVAFGVDYICTYDAYEALDVYNSIKG